jgi:glycosyltransferase involved in cell wall biosynthesis
LYDLRSVFEIWRLFRHLRPDLVHNVAMKPVIFGGIVARFGGVRRVVQAVPGLGSGFTGIGRRVELRRRLMLWALRAACARQGTLVILQNVEDIQTLVESGVIASDAAVLIRGSGVDVRAIALQPEAPGCVRVVLAARMLREKGIGEFVSAAHLLRQQGVTAEFLLAGDPDPSNPGSFSTAELGRFAASGVVRYLGHVQDVPALFSTCHVVCLPTYYGEGVPKVLIEAAASGRAIVTTDTPGCRDIVKAGVNGLLVPVREVQALADALRQVIDNPGLRRRFGVAGRERALVEFDFSIVLKQTLKTYERLLGPPCESS